MLVSCVKDLIVRYFPNRALRLQAYLRFLELLKVEWEAEPSVIRPLSCANCQFRIRKQTPSLPLRLGLKHSYFIELIVRDGSGNPETSHSYSATDLDCWGTSHVASFWTLLSFTHDVHMTLLLSCISLPQQVSLAWCHGACCSLCPLLTTPIRLR